MYRYLLLSSSTRSVIFSFDFHSYILSHFMVIWDWQNRHEYQNHEYTNPFSVCSAFLVPRTYEV